MSRRFVSSVVASACATVAAAAACAAEPDRPALTVLLGWPSATASGWGGGTMAGAVSIDRPFSQRVAAVIVSGTARGVHGEVPPHQEIELASTYLVAGLRFSAETAAGPRVYALAAVGALRADVRDRVSGWPVPETYVVRDSSTGAAALLGAGAIFAIPRSRCSVVADVSYLAPRLKVPAGVGGSVPAQLVATAGVRVALGR